MVRCLHGKSFLFKWVLYILASIEEEYKFYNLSSQIEEHILLSMCAHVCVCVYVCMCVFGIQFLDCFPYTSVSMFWGH